MADYNLKTAAEDTSLDTNAFLFGADSQSASSPSVYKVSTLKTLLLGGGSLSIASGKTLTASNALTLTGTDGSSVSFGTGGTVLYSGGALGTPTSGTLTNATGLPISTGVSGLGTGIATALAVNTGSAGAPVLFNGAGGTPSSLTLTNATGLPVGGISATGTPSGTTYLRGDGTWATPAGGGGTPGGSDTQIQYNNAGSFGGLSQLTYSGGKINVVSAPFGLSGNISSAAWTTSGIRYANAAATLTDTSSSGTVAAAYTDLFGGNTIAASNSTTFTDYYTMFVSGPTAGTNVTFTNRWALGLSGNLRVSGGTVTASAPALDISQTWNNAAVGFTAAKINVTKTAAAAASYYFDIQRGGTTFFNVGLYGVTLFGDAAAGYTAFSFAASNSDTQPALMLGNGASGSTAANYGLFIGAGGTSVVDAGVLRASANTLRIVAGNSSAANNGNLNVGVLGFGPGATTANTFVTSAAAATLQLGAADAAAPVAQTLQVQNVVAGTSGNVAGTNFTINGSRGVGSGAGGSIIFQVAPAGTAGATTQNALATALTIASDTSATFTGMVQSRAGSYNNPAVALGSGSSGVYITGNSGFGIFSGGSGIGTLGTTSWTLFSGNDIVLARDAANTLALKNSTNAQIFRAYSTTASSGSYGYLAAGVTDAGVATADTLFIGTGGTGAALTKLAFAVNGTTRLDYNVSSAGNWTFSGSVISGQDVAMGAARYFRWTGRSEFFAPADGVVCVWNNAGTSFDRFQFGGTTSSFPALKRSTTTLQVRLADDSAFAPLSCGNTTASGTALDVSGTGAASLFSVTNTTTGTLFSVVNASAANLLTVSDTVTTGTQIVGTAFGLTGNISAAAWTTSGIRYRNVAATLTDTSSTGTVATAYTDVFGGNTIAASNSTTFTNYATFRITGPSAGTNVTLTNAWALSLGGGLIIDDAYNLAVGTTTGTKIGTATSQKLGFWNATPIVQPTTAVAAATVAATGTGDVVAASTTFDGYTIPQIVKALRNAGLLA